MSLCCSATFVSAQRDAPGRSLARAGAPGVQQHSYAPPFPPPAPPGRGEPHGSQDGYKRFQQQLWEQRQRGGPWAVKSRRNTERGIVASPAALRVPNEPSYLPLLLLCSSYLCRSTPYNAFASPRRLSPQRLTLRHGGALGRRRMSRRRTRRCCSTRRSG